jgi:hypothetical protein
MPPHSTFIPQRASTDVLGHKKNEFDSRNIHPRFSDSLWVISAAGKHLGTIIAPKHVHNMAWGDEDGKTLYLCARNGLYRLRLNVAGVRPVQMAMQ